MLGSLLTLVPVGVALGLLTFGRYGDRTPVPLTPGRIVPVGIVAVLLGPVAVTVLGVFVWFLGIAILVAATAMVALLRTPPPAPPLRG
jgi:MFS family permease